MKKLDIKLEHCFGIYKLNCNFDFTNSNMVLIYAPNGMMKSSFAKTFECIASGDKKNQPKDRIYTDRQSVCEITADGIAIDPKTIFVSNGDINIDSENRISTFLASKELKKRYDAIYSELNELKQEFIKKLKAKSHSTDCEQEFVSAFGIEKNNDLFSCLNQAIEHLNTPYVLYDFKYNDIFDKKGNVAKFLEANRDILQEYFDNYTSLLKQSSFFRPNAEGISFGTYQANDLSSSVKDGAFFLAKHKIVLQTNEEICSSDALQELIEREITGIFEDEKLKKSFEKIDRAIAKNAELKAFKLLIEKQNELIPLLVDYNIFRRNVWLGYLYSIKESVVDILSEFNKRSEELRLIIRKANEENKAWVSIIDLYNSRFSVPFKVIITNQEDIVLKQTTASLDFEYKDTIGDSVKQDKETMLKILSNGEKRAFFILQLLFEIEARKCLGGHNLIILDDIAESFDYKNKYAILEYIADLYNDNRFRIIILTHNFDFYRTIDSRLVLRNSVYMVIKDNNSEIKLHRGEYRRDAFGHLSKHGADPKVFISLISFARNIIEYTKGQSCTEYTTLTECLHFKKNSKNITANDVSNILAANIHNTKDLQIDFASTGIVDLIFETASKIAGTNPYINEILIENKLVLSIACRLYAEMFIIDLLNPDTDEIGKDQTRVLIQQYRDSKSCDIETLKILERVNLMTPENIHLNSFMYEPIIDMSVLHLVELYNQLRVLNAK